MFLLSTYSRSVSLLITRAAGEKIQIFFLLSLCQLSYLRKSEQGDFKKNLFLSFWYGGEKASCGMMAPPPWEEGKMHDLAQMYPPHFVSFAFASFLAAGTLLDIPGLAFFSFFLLSRISMIKKLFFFCRRRHLPALNPITILWFFFFLCPSYMYCAGNQRWWRFLFYIFAKKKTPTFKEEGGTKERKGSCQLTFRLVRGGVSFLSPFLAQNLCEGKGCVAYFPFWHCSNITRLRWWPYSSSSLSMEGGGGGRGDLIWTTFFLPALTKTEEDSNPNKKSY